MPESKPDSSRPLNIGDRLGAMAKNHPHRRALIFPEGRDRAGRVAYAHLTFRQLESLSDQYAHGLRDCGIERGMRTLLMVRPNLDFTALAFALFKLGAVPVMIDPGMGIRGFVRCVRQVEPQAMIGIPLAHFLRRLLRPWFRSVKIPVTLGRSRLAGGFSTDDLLRRSRDRGSFPTVPTEADETAAILFTTGSTGPAKGVVYTHGIFDTQVEIMRRVYGITPEDTDLPCFPLFALFSTALGACAVIPDMNPTRPAEVDPRKIIEAIENHAVTYSFGSPALWRTVTAHCVEHGIRFPTLKKVLMAGAPIPDYIHDRLLNHILGENALTHTPYGATEALPVANITGREVLDETWQQTRIGRGVCVGRPLDCLEVRIIEITDDPIAKWRDSLELEAGKTGEIVVKGPVVTPQYFRLPQATELAKIHDPDGSIRHRMGDLGYLDPQGRLWVCGRKSHRVRTAQGEMYTICCEAIFNQHPAVYRSALVGVPTGRDGYQRPAVIIEPEPGQFPNTEDARDRLRAQLLELAAASPLTGEIRDLLFHRAFPVDIRHNAKIKREILGAWAARQLRS